MGVSVHPITTFGFQGRTSEGFLTTRPPVQLQIYTMHVNASPEWDDLLVTVCLAICASTSQQHALDTESYMFFLASAAAIAASNAAATATAAAMDTEVATAMETTAHGGIEMAAPASSLSTAAATSTTAVHVASLATTDVETADTAAMVAPPVAMMPELPPPPLHRRVSPYHIPCDPAAPPGRFWRDKPEWRDLLQKGLPFPPLHMRSSSRGGNSGGISGGGGGGGESKDGKGDGDFNGEESRKSDGFAEESQATTQATSSQASSQATEATAMVTGGDTLDTLAAATADAMAVATAVATAAAAAAAAAVAEETGVGLLPLAAWARIVTIDGWFFQFALARSSRGAGGSFAAVVAAMCHSAWESKYHSRTALTWVTSGLKVCPLYD